jgi:IS30 family transposase
MPYTHLTQNDRYVISHLKCTGFSLREIARRIDRHHTTISRELKRNGPDYEDAAYVVVTLSLTHKRNFSIVLTQKAMSYHLIHLVCESKYHQLA